ncbi:recombinase RecT [Candidatus Sodalis sp. SoCistrobi]|uniref:recombinase RecT n=1 Tax=Candidatus Sodalis sp. SoCistrobi TaxID=1922216 RepID=UPI00093F1D4F
MIQTAAKESSPWQKHYREMAIKTVTKRLCKRLPGAAEIYSLLDVGHSGADHSRQPGEQCAPPLARCAEQPQIHLGATGRSTRNRAGAGGKPGSRTRGHAARTRGCAHRVR